MSYRVYLLSDWGYEHHSVNYVLLGPADADIHALQKELEDLVGWKTIPRYRESRKLKDPEYRAMIEQFRADRKACLKNLYELELRDPEALDQYDKPYKEKNGADENDMLGALRTWLIKEHGFEDIESEEVGYFT